MKWTRIGGMAAFLAALAIGLAFSLGLWANWTAGAAGTERIVNAGTGAGDPAPCGTPNFASVSDIQTVIDDASVQNGDTLVLCPGTYTAGAVAGAVEVDKELTITGLGTANREDVVVQGTAASHGFTIKADNIKIKHLKLAGAGIGGADHGIHVEAAGPTTYDNGEFSDLEITNWNVGITMAQSNNTKIGPNNDIHGNGGSGVTITGGPLGGQGDKVFNNVIGPNEGVGILLAQIDEAYIQENTLAGNVAVQILVSAESNALIWNNSIEATANFGVLVSSTTADTMVQIGGSPGRANNFTGTLAPGVGYYVNLECGSENTVDATYNYWNGINSNAGISPAVFNDEFDDPGAGPDCAGDDKGAVVVHPFVTTMWTPTPTPTPSPSATATGTPTPTSTPGGATRTVNLSPQGWQTFVWSGPNATDPAAALTCISGKYAIAYEWVGTTTPAQWLRYIPGNSLLSNITVVNKYDSLLIAINAAGVTCDMPVAP
jgi:hypothetical protein